MAGSLAIGWLGQRYRMKWLLAWMYAGMKQIAPGADPGIELGREYDLAMDLFKGRRG